jgi:hypothetical protein
MEGLSRFIVTVETSKHRIFSFLSREEKPEHKLVVIGADDAFVLGVLSSSIHVTYSLSAGGWLGVGNDPVYSKSRCFDPFPFPVCTETQRRRIRGLAEELDRYRKTVQHRDRVTLTVMYNVLEKLRSSSALSTKEQRVYKAGFISILRKLHDDIDAAVFDAYGWPVTLPESEILMRVIELNASRVNEERTGVIRWLRPDYQTLDQEGSAHQKELALTNKEAPTEEKPGKQKKGKLPWPSTLSSRVQAVETLLHTTGRPVAASEIAAKFRRADVGTVGEILETLVTLGRARHKEGEKFAT